MVKGSTLEARLVRNCIQCNKDFLAKQHNTKTCEQCKLLQNEVQECKCGCKKLAKRRTNFFAQGCSKRGKTYQEIYKKSKSEIKNGFKKGLENPNYTTPHSSFKKVKLNSIGESFRSSLEVLFSEYLLKRNIKYTFEKIREVIDEKKGTVKIVDFLINDSVYVEVTGYCSNQWQDTFDFKGGLLKQKLDNKPIPAPLLLLTYPKNLQKLTSIHSQRDTFIENIYNEQEIIKKIVSLNNMYYLNTYIGKKNSIEELPQKLYKTDLHANY